MVGEVNFLPYNVDDVREKLDNVEERATADRSRGSFSDLMQKEDDRRRSGKPNERFVYLTSERWSISLASSQGSILLSLEREMLLSGNWISQQTSAAKTDPKLSPRGSAGQWGGT